MMRTIENVKTPNGGNKLDVYYLDDDMQECDVADATNVRIIEYDDDGMLAETWGAI